MQAAIPTRSSPGVRAPSSECAVTTPIVTDFQGCSFKGLDLARFITEWKDSRQPALAVHRYLQRDGGEVEPMGRKPHEVKVTLAFAGKTWRSDWLPIAASIDDDPKGPLVHPVYGRMQTACQGFESATMNVETAANLYIVPLGFIEDSVDSRIVSDSAQGPAGKAAVVEATGAALLQRSPAQPQIRGSLLRLVTTASAFASSALDTTLALGSSHILPTVLDAVRQQVLDTRQVLRATVSDTQSYETLVGIEQLYDACLSLDNALRASGPALFVYVVPSLTSLVALAARLYRADAVARMPEILANNRGRIPNPAAIRAGTELILRRPTSF